MQTRHRHRLLLFELGTGHGAEVKADVEQRLCYVCARLVFLLLFIKKKKKGNFCMHSCVWRNVLNFKKLCPQKKVWLLYLLTSILDFPALHF